MNFFKKKKKPFLKPINQLTDPEFISSKIYTEIAYVETLLVNSGLASSRFTKTLVSIFGNGCGSEASWADSEVNAIGLIAFG